MRKSALEMKTGCSVRELLSISLTASLRKLIRLSIKNRIKFPVPKKASQAIWNLKALRSKALQLWVHHITINRLSLSLISHRNPLKTLQGLLSLPLPECVREPERIRTVMIHRECQNNSEQLQDGRGDHLEKELLQLKTALVVSEHPDSPMRSRMWAQSHQLPLSLGGSLQVWDTNRQILLAWRGTATEKLHCI